MKRYFYNYQTIIRFSSPVTRHSFLLRSVPCRNACQVIDKNAFYLNPWDDLCHCHDSWGNPIQYGSKSDVHDSFVWVSCGEAMLTSYAIPADCADSLFTCASALTAPSPQMRKFLASATAINCLPAPSATAIDHALALSDAIHAHMQYVPCSTDFRTTAAESFALGKGVCQDYAHILIALCRAIGVPARYSNGFIPGEGQTHAWVEVFDGKAWRGVDPTHNRLIEYGYIKLSHGRDAADCPVNRGSFIGTAIQQTEVRVTVEEI